MKTLNSYINENKGNTITLTKTSRFSNIAKFKSLFKGLNHELFTYCNISDDNKNVYIIHDDITFPQLLNFIKTNADTLGVDAAF